MHKCGRSDKRVAIGAWIRDHQRRAAPRNLHVYWQDAGRKGRQNVLFKPFSQDPGLHWVGPFLSKHADLQLKQGDGGEILLLSDY